MRDEKWGANREDGGARRAFVVLREDMWPRLCMLTGKGSSEGGTEDSREEWWVPRNEILRKREGMRFGNKVLCREPGEWGRGTRE